MDSKDQQDTQHNVQAATLAMLMAEMYPVVRQAITGGCDDPECSCGGHGDQGTVIIQFDPLVN
jgi:hypothetical protein